MLRRPLALATMAVLILGCGASSTPSTSSLEPTEPPTAPPSASTSPTSTTDAIEAVIAAVIQVETTADIRAVAPGEAPGIGAWGSGFLIDPSGLALTNGHVVAGAESITVYVGGERFEQEAEVVATAECSDLALIRLGGPGPYPTLDWYEGEIGPGLEIYAAGYPLGDPEFTLTDGIVTRAHGVIDEAWASVEDSIEHGATTNPGSSGGPVVTRDGQIVGVHYGGFGSTRQQFAISREETRRVLPDLLAGRDVASLGLLGEADTQFGPAGIFVTTVTPGSPAAEAGVFPGDRITSLDDEAVAADGTMGTYCDILRRHETGDVVDFELYRTDTDETLAGEFNGDPVDPAFTFLAAVGDDPAAAPPFSDALPIFGQGTALAFDGPTAWTDTEDMEWLLGATAARGVLASSDNRAFRSGWETPGVLVAASDQAIAVDDAAILDDERARFSGLCRTVERAEFERPNYRGVYDLWTDCPEPDTKFLTIAATAADGSHRVYLQFQAPTDDDLAALDRVLATLEVDFAT